METLRPIDQLGWARATSAVTFAISSRTSAERATGCRQDDALHRLLMVARQALEDRTMLAVDRDQPATTLLDGSKENIAG